MNYRSVVFGAIGFLQLLGLIGYLLLRFTNVFNTKIDDSDFDNINEETGKISNNSTFVDVVVILIFVLSMGLTVWIWWDGLKTDIPTPVGTLYPPVPAAAAVPVATPVGPSRPPRPSSAALADLASAFGKNW